MTSSPRDFGPLFWALIGATFLSFLGIGAVLPALGPHVRHDLGGTDQTVGLVIGVFSFVAVLARFISGPLADTRGRKIAFFGGLVSCGLAGATYLLPLRIPGVYLGRIFQGFGEACIYTGAAAWAVELAGIERSSQALGYISSGIWGGLSAGPVAGDWLHTFNRAAVLQIVTVGLAFLLLARIPEKFRARHREGERTWIPRSMILPGCAIGFVNVQYPVIAGFLILHLAQHGNSGPAAFSAFAGMMLFSRFFFGGIPDRIHPALTYYFGIVAMACGLVVLASGPSPAIAVGAAALLGLGYSFPFSSVASTVLRQTPASAHGTAIGVLGVFYDLFVGVSSFAAGTVSSRYGYPGAFYMGAAALGAAAVVGALVFPARERL